MLVLGGVPTEALAEAVELAAPQEETQMLGEDSEVTNLGEEGISASDGIESSDEDDDAEAMAEEGKSIAVVQGDGTGAVSFVDVTTATAHYEDIQWLADTGISKGWSTDGGLEFRPYANVARSDMAAFLFRLAMRWGLVSDAWQPTGAMSFADVTSATSHYREIMWLAESGISLGWEVEGTREFRPVTNVARADIAAFLHRLANKAGIQAPSGTGVVFSDVMYYTAHAEDIAWLAATGISRGWQVEDGYEFRPTVSVARADMAAFLHRLDDLRGGDEPVEPVPSTYTIKYNANGGSGTMAAQTVNRDTSVALAANAFTRTNYSFAGWNTKADGTGKTYANKASVKNLAAANKTATLYAQWKVQTYTIAFDANGGTGTMSSQTAERGASVALAANAFTRTNYAFAGWNTKADGSGTQYADKASVKNLVAANKTATLYGQWTQQTYTIAYNANGGVGTMSSQTAARGANVSLSANAFTYSGRTFAGWNTKADGTGTSYADKATVSNLAAAGKTATLYAQWKSNTYTIIYDPSDAPYGYTLEQEAQCGVDVTLKYCPYNFGYTFLGWCTTATGSGTTYKSGSTVRDLAPAGGTITLYARWAYSTYTVKFNANGGSGTMADQTMSKDATQYLNANKFTRSGYTFKGWNTRSDGLGTAYADQASVYNLASAGSSVTLYAQWGRESYTIYYNANGGSGSMAAQTAEINTSVYLKTCGFTRSGYTFTTWNTNASGTGTTYLAGESVRNLRSAGGSITLYAQWRKNASTYTIYFNANGGSGGPGSQKVEVGKTTSLSTVKPTRSGYTFVGWNTQSNGWGTQYSSGGSYSSSTGTNGSVTLYAYWRQNTGKGWNEDYIWDIFNAYNEWRRNQGLNTVAVDGTCWQYAVGSAQGCANRGQLVHRLGIPADKQNQYSDILQYSSWEKTGKEVVNSWANSSGHAAQMRCRTAQWGGVGVVVQNGIYWIALVYTFSGTNVG